MKATERQCNGDVLVEMLLEADLKNAVAEKVAASIPILVLSKIRSNNWWNDNNAESQALCFRATRLCQQTSGILR